MKLTTKTRRKIPSAQFGMPAERKYPMPDATHAVAAKSRATQMENRGVISASTADKIKAKANRKLDGDGEGHWSGH